jgi:hypothetical protein
MVSPKNPKNLAGPAVSRNMQPVRLVGGHVLLESLSLVQTGFDCLSASYLNIHYTLFI